MLVRATAVWNQCPTTTTGLAIYAQARVLPAHIFRHGWSQ